MYEGKIKPRPDRYRIQYYDFPNEKWASEYRYNIDDALRGLSDIRKLGHDPSLIEYPTSEYPDEW